MTRECTGGSRRFRPPLQRTIVRTFSLDSTSEANGFRRAFASAVPEPFRPATAPRFFDVQSQCSRGVSDPRDGPGVRVAFQEGGRSRHGCSTVPLPRAAKNAAQGDATVARGASQLTERDGLRDCAGAPSEAEIAEGNRQTRRPGGLKTLP
jgi:hypothetical protein